MKLGGEKFILNFGQIFGQFFKVTYFNFERQILEGSRRPKWPRADVAVVTAGLFSLNGNPHPLLPPLFACLVNVKADVVKDLERVLQSVSRMILSII